MSIIEQAARRLEELRRSGIDVPAGRAAVPAAAPKSGLVSVHTAKGSIAPEVVQVPVVPKGGRASKQVNIDLQRLAAMGYLTPETPRSQLADEFRVIKRPLLANIRGRMAESVKNSNLIMVTSSVPGEGKTFVSVNLAISLAMELDTTVLLVDADVSRPAVLGRLGLPQSPGLLDILTKPAIGVSDVLLRTNIEKLSILPAGAPQGRATEILSGDGMRMLLEDLANRYPDRILIFDAPPLLPSTESRVLATLMGQVVLVVQAEHAPIKTVTQSLATLEACPVVMPLLNKISRSEVGTYYGYYDPVEA